MHRGVANLQIVFQPRRRDETRLRQFRIVIHWTLPAVAEGRCARKLGPSGDELALVRVVSSGQLTPYKPYSSRHAQLRALRRDASQLFALRAL